MLPMRKSCIGYKQGTKKVPYHRKTAIAFTPEGRFKLQFQVDKLMSLCCTKHTQFPRQLYVEDIKAFNFTKKLPLKYGATGEGFWLISPEGNLQYLSSYRRQRKNQPYLLENNILSCSTVQSYPTMCSFHIQLSTLSIIIPNVSSFEAKIEKSLVS